MFSKLLALMLLIVTLVNAAPYQGPNCVNLVNACDEGDTDACANLQLCESSDPVGRRRETTCEVLGSICNQGFSKKACMEFASKCPLRRRRQDTSTDLIKNCLVFRAGCENGKRLACRGLDVFRQKYPNLC